MEQVRTRPFEIKKPHGDYSSWGLWKGRVGKARCAGKVKEKVFVGWGTIPNSCSFRLFYQTPKPCQEVF